MRRSCLHGGMRRRSAGSKTTRLAVIPPPKNRLAKRRAVVQPLGSAAVDDPSTGGPTRCSCANRARVVMFAVASCLSLVAADLAAAHEISPQRLTPIVICRAASSNGGRQHSRSENRHRAAEPGTSAGRDRNPRQCERYGHGARLSMTRVTSLPITMSSPTFDASK